jgi:REP element-mobilizing transposase RayT
MSGKYLSLLVHFTWSTAHREPWIKQEWREPLFADIGGIMRNKNARLLAAGGVSDHIHLYASLPSTLSLAEFVNAVKSNSSRWVHQTYRDARGFAWQEGYGAFSVSKSAEKRVISYVRSQEQHHRKHSFQEEFLKLLEKHKIDYDERYLWD